jgi:A/G-specific adenine glycosylase
MDWFAQRLLAWHDDHGRKDLPWQQDTSPYRVWVSEIMLQQTQVTTVIDYYRRFMRRFPTVADLAEAPLDEVLHLWTGLGYYARARNLHKAAHTIVDEHNGTLPDTQAALEALPGIGRSTAGAILALAMHQHAVILDGNVKRVLTRFHAVPGYPGTTAVAKALWRHAADHTPERQTATYTQAIMDLGATLCTRRNPRCADCPLSEHCEAFARGTTGAFPEPKPKVVKPLRHARLFVVTLPNGAVLLEQKPASGLWGGLWTPPERAADTTLESFIAELGWSANHVAGSQVAPAFRHSFTHFHLQIEPVYLQLTRTPEQIEDTAGRRWVDPAKVDDADPIGLSAPAVKLLASLQDVFPPPTS